MKFTNSQKIWLLSNLRHFFKQDPYLKYLDSEVLLQRLKKKLKDERDFEQIKADLPKEYFKPFKFYRKKEKYFIYPSLVTQIETLFGCWDEILAIKKIQDPQFGILTLSDEDDILDDEDESLESSVSHLKRRNFGQSPNAFSHYKLNGKAQLKIHIRSRVSFIKRNFTKEYVQFKKRIVTTCHEICNRGKSAYVVQTDIKSFFHNIKTSDIEKLLKKHFPKKSKKLIAAIEKVRNEIQTEELPIGWILSGVISDIVLALVQEELRKKAANSCHYINYVDDFVIINEVEKDDLSESSVTPCFDLLEGVFKELLEGSKIEFYKEGEKNRTWRLDQETLGIVDMSWFDFGDASIESDEASKWTAVNEFLLPADNDLDFNERIQFLENLKSIKRKVLNDEIRTWEHFSDYFKKIIFKLSRTGARYIPSVVETLMVFTRSNDFPESECIEKLDELYRIISTNDPNASTWLALFGSLKKYSDKPEMSTWIVLRSKDVANFHLEAGKRDDYFLLCSWINLFQNSDSFYGAKGSLGVKENQLFFYSESMLLIELVSILDKEKEKIADCFKNEFLVTNALIKRRRKFQGKFDEKLEELSRDLIQIKDKLGVVVYSNFLLEGLYYFSDLLTFDFLEQISKGLRDHPGYLLEKSIVRADDLISQVSDSREDAMKYIYIMNPEEKLANYKSFIKQLYSPTKQTKKYIKWIAEEDDVLVASREMTVLYLHLSATVDHWKKVLLYKGTTFDNANYISTWVYPDIYPELGLIFFAISKNLLNLNVESVLLARCDNSISEIIKAKSGKVSKVNFEDGVLKLNIDHVLRDAEKRKQQKDDKVFVTLGHVDFDIDKDYNPENSYGHSARTIVELSKKINQSLNQAIKTRSTFLVFPELCIPRKELRSLLEKSSLHGITVIAGIEARADSEKMYRNTTVISIPVKKQISILGKSYLAFYQYKNYPAAVEDYLLSQKGFQYVQGTAIYWIVSKALGSFSVLTCSDFLATSIKAILKTKVQLLFVPAVNHDNSTYNVIAESCIRELFCCCIICNNSRKGASLVMMPFKEPHARLVLSSHGLSSPGYSTININLSDIEKMQSLTPRSVEQARHNPLDTNHKLVKLFKQLPPDWPSK